MALFEPLPALSVSELALLIKENLENDLRLANLWVRGEVSDFKHHRASGHYYFTLKDEYAVLPAVMFRKRAQTVNFKLEDGLTVLARGSVSIYEKSGRYQMYVEEMEPYGYGQLALQLEQLKRRLEAEGLFDAARKRQLPMMPRTVGVVTSRDGAAVRDILRVSRSRFPALEVIVAPVIVQGQEAAADIARGIASLASWPEVEVIIVGRGGGSFQDLFAFNAEEVVRAVAASRVPVISAVGHEVDITLCDLAADVRAATPTQAAVLVVPEMEALRNELTSLVRRLNRAMGSYLARCQMELDQQAGSKVLSAPENVLLAKQDSLERLLNSRVFRDPDCLIAGHQDRLRTWAERLVLAMRGRLKTAEQELTAASAHLDSLSPLRVLGRGYTLARTREGQIIDSATGVHPGQELELVWQDGQARALVSEVETITIESEGGTPRRSIRKG